MNTTGLPSDKHWLLPMTGLRCAGCVKRLENSLQSQVGVVSAQTNLALSTLDIAVNGDKSLAEVVAWVESAGFGVSASTDTYTLENASCGSCVRKIETQVAQLPGVLSAQFNLALSQLTVTGVDGLFQPQKLLETLTKLNYPLVTEDSSIAIASEKPFNRELWPVVIGLLLALPMVLVMLLNMLGVSVSIAPVVQFLLASPVQFWLGYRFYKGAFISLRHGSANMDVLVAIGTSAAYGYSLFLWLVEGSSHLYFEASALVIALVLLGRWLENRAKRVTSQAIRQLMDLQPKTVKVWRDKSLVNVSVESIKAGDEVQVSPGELISVDGDIIEGESDINEAMLTGESVPVHRQVGQLVLAGTQNIDGSLRIRVAKSAHEFRVKQIADWVAKAQMQKPAVQQLVDRIAAVFVPVVIAIALVTFLLQFYGQNFDTALAAAISVLVIACPCALGLATPTAIIAASGVGAKRGLLIKDIDQLQTIARVSHCVFDKTGTLTEGQLSVAHHHIWGDNPEQIYAVVRSVEARSQHPLAEAVCQSLEAYPDNLPIENFQNHSGKGVSARVQQAQYLLGNSKLMQDHGLNLDAYQTYLRKAHATVVWVAKQVDSEWQMLGVFELEDKIKNNGDTLCQWLRQSSIHTWLLSGDNQAAADYVGQQLAIDHIYGDLLPDDKLKKIEQIKAKQGVTVMIGDGINDAPALASADASIAMGNGTDIAMETAGITLMRPDVLLVAEAIQLARKTQQKIRQNLFWAFIYNIIGIPLAALGWLNPMLAGAAMAFSSVSVVASSMLLLHWRPSPFNHKNEPHEN